MPPPLISGGGNASSSRICILINGIGALGGRDPCTLPYETKTASLYSVAISAQVLSRLLLIPLATCFFNLPAMSEIVCRRCGLHPDRTQVGRLSPWEVAKACAFSAVLQRMGSHLDQMPCEILGERVDTFISKQLTLEGGGNPTPRAVRLLLMKCKSTAYVPGKFPENRGGRKRTYTEHQEKEAARVAMTLKAQRRRVCPALVRATLPKKLVNPCSRAPLRSLVQLARSFARSVACSLPRSLACPARSFGPLAR